MEYASAQILLFVSLFQATMSELAHGLLDRMTLGAGIHLILCPTILSGTLALLVKYLTAVRILPLCKLVSGSLLVLLVSWYIDRICRNNAYLLVRSVGLAIVFCAVLGVVIVSEDRFAEKRTGIEAEAVAAAEYVVARD